MRDACRYHDETTHEVIYIDHTSYTRELDAQGQMGEMTDLQMVLEAEGLSL